MNAYRTSLAKGRFSVCLFVFAIWTLVLCSLVYCAQITTVKMRCALGCEPNGAPLHRFPDPFKFPEQFKAWVEIMGDSLENPEDHQQYKHKRICHIHFKVEDRNRNHRLKKTAVPSLHLPMWCNRPPAVTNSTTPNTESTIKDDVAETEPTSFLPDEIIVEEHNYCLQSGCTQTISGDGDCEQSNIDFITNAASLCYDKMKNNSFQAGSAQISEQPSTSITTENTSKDDHNYLSTPCSSIQPVGPFNTANATDEHNYSTNMSKSSQKGKRTTYNALPSHLATKLNTSSRQVKNLKREVIRLRRRGLNFKARLENAEKLSNNLSFQIITKNMSTPAKIFTAMQFREGAKKPKGRRFTMEEKILSLTIFKKSSRCYALLARLFALPSKKSLKSLLSNVQLKTGINSIVFEKIKKTVVAMNSDKKICTLIFDEMSISPHVDYDASKDKIKGLTGKQQIADHVLVFMVKGIKANFKQPVAYYFTNSLNKTELKSTLIDVIKNVQATGLQVLCTVCDQSSVNTSTINSLVDDTKLGNTRRGHEFNFLHFRVNDKVIIPLYDVPHLLKGLRNNLLTKDLIYKDEFNNEKRVKWEYFEKLYAADTSYGELRIAHKLTEEHVNKEKMKKMRVKTAAQIFSHSVAVAIEHYSARGDLPPECRDLIPVVLLIDKVFDSLNGNTFHIPNGKIYKGSVKRSSPHHSLWKGAIKMLKTFKFITKRKSAGKVRFIEATVPSVTNLIKTIEGVQILWKMLNEKYSFDSLLTRNLNQDPVENFFGNIRSYGVRNVAPNSVQFEGAYKSLLLNNYNTPHSIQANCEEDRNHCLQSFDFFLDKPDASNIPGKKNDNIVFNIDVINVEGESATDKGQRNYVCGWVLTKCFKNVTKNCIHCRADLNGNKDMESNSLIRAKEYNKRKSFLIYPTEKVIETFQEVQRITCAFLKSEVPEEGLKTNIKMMCDALISYPFTCKTHKLKLEVYFVETTINVLIYSWCRSINRIIKGKITYDFSENNQLKLEAYNYYMKHKHNKTVK